MVPVRDDKKGCNNMMGFIDWTSDNSCFIDSPLMVLFAWPGPFLNHILSIDTKNIKKDQTKLYTWIAAKNTASTAKLYLLYTRR